MRLRLYLMAVLVLAGGCSGEYLLTAPDVAAPAGESAPVVVRLQRREFWFHAPPQADAAVTFRLPGRPLQCARTDKAGYACVGVDPPDGPGRYQVQIHYQDQFGQVVRGRAEIFVLSPDKPILAVDMDSLPAGGEAARAASAALRQLAQQAQLLYLTQRQAHEPAAAGELLAQGGYPQGPVLPWAKQRWWKLLPWWKRLDEADTIAALRHRLGNLHWGATAGASAAGAFDRAGLKVLLVGEASAQLSQAEYFKSWSEVTLPPVGQP